MPLGDRDLQVDPACPLVGGVADDHDLGVANLCADVAVVAVELDHPLRVLFEFRFLVRPAADVIHESQ